MKTLDDALRCMLEDTDDFWARHKPTIEALTVEPRLLQAVMSIQDALTIKSFPFSPLHPAKAHDLSAALLSCLSIGLALGTEMEKP